MNGHSKLKLDALRNIQSMELGVKQMCQAAVELAHNRNTSNALSLGNGRGCPLVVHYWADLQLVHGFRCYENVAPNAKCQ